ncbi:hypothetical protein EVAR_73723_1 [Eumeta japonica]|uniref:Retrovirus-related Pol polyprotein from transposon TNT 1-94 n=1 Tax=Eumeta variegata TaxID=151549 RepID=A0A4C1SM94_EUMVA|nr:hypothetical protein EVAR_73723_1 [Eumeta japonica]
MNQNFYIPGCDSVGEIDDPVDNEASPHIANENVSVDDEVNESSSEETYYSETEDTYLRGSDDRSSDWNPGPSLVRITSPENVRRSSRVPKPAQRYGFECNMVQIDEVPKTIMQALESPNKEKWEQAINDELDALIQNGTWEIVRLPKGRNLLIANGALKSRKILKVM